MHFIIFALISLEKGLVLHLNKIWLKSPQWSWRRKSFKILASLEVFDLPLEKFDQNLKILFDLEKKSQYEEIKDKGTRMTKCTHRRLLKTH